MYYHQKRKNETDSYGFLFNLILFFIIKKWEKEQL